MASCTPSRNSRTLPVTNHQPTPAGSGSSSRWRGRRGSPYGSRASRGRRCSIRAATRTLPSRSRGWQSARAARAAGPIRHLAGAVVGAAVARAYQLLRLGVPAHAASQVRAGGIERRSRASAGAHQEHRAAIDHLLVAVLAVDAQHHRRRLVDRQIVKRPGRQPRASRLARPGDSTAPPITTPSVPPMTA